MPEPSVKIFVQQAELLYQRGVAAAKGGQKTVAETLLRQAVRLNPQHEQAWLWLSGVLEKPADVAFCLRAVLDINPANTRARRGLELVEQTTATAAERKPATLSPMPQSTPADGWWTSWRDAQTTWRRTVRLLLLIPIILIGATLGVRAVIAAAPLPEFASAEQIPTPVPIPTATPAPPTPTAPVVVTPTPTSRTIVAAYFEQVNAERATLDVATDAYRATTDGARTSAERATATRQLRDQVQRSLERFGALEAPVEITPAHQLYTNGLREEQAALDLLLEFYSSYNVALTNQAALRLQEARTQIATATASWDAFAEQNDVPRFAPPTP